MLLGDFQRAWEISDRVLEGRKASPGRDEDLPLHLRSVWRGEALAGKSVLVRCYHGLGDTIQFIRYAEPLNRICRRVSVQAPAVLLPLLHSVRGIDFLTALEDGSELPDYDVDIESLELPYAFRTSLATIPSAVPYPRPPCAAGHSALRPLRVGLAWSGGSWNPRRSMKISDLQPLLEAEGVEFFSLQRGPEAAELKSSRLGSHIIDLESGPADLTRTAAAILSLHLVISVDTMVAHLAGALGKPVWILLPYAADWRWLVEREDSPWYPTMRLFRQASDRSWESPLARVSHELANLSKRALPLWI